jgi:hypothetical protein
VVVDVDGDGDGDVLGLFREPGSANRTTIE